MYIKRYAWLHNGEENERFDPGPKQFGVEMLTATLITYVYCTWFPGAEKRTFSEMQRRRFQDVQEDEPQEKRELIEDLLLQELTRGEYTPKGKYMSLISRVRGPYCKM